MKLNIDIIYDNLKEQISAEISGIRKSGLHLGRPEYYTGNGAPLLADHLYVVKAEKLPQRAPVEKTSAIICIGNGIHLPYYRQKCSVIQIKEAVDCFSVFNTLTRIYDKYDAWHEQLSDILNTSASLQEMISCSRTIFDNPIFVLNANFHYLAHSDYSDIALAEWDASVLRQNESGELPLTFLGKFLETYELSTQVKEPMLINLLDSSTLNVNLFDSTEYCGCLSIDYRLRPYRDSDQALATHLARMIEFALKKYSYSLGNEKNALRQALIDLIDGLQISLSQRRMIDTAHLDSEHVCIKIRFNSRLAQLPVGYLCSMIEQDFPGNVAFEYDSAIVCFIETRSLSGRDYVKQLTSLIHSIGFDVGISDSFQDIYKARLYYLQTCAALENGRLFAPLQHYYLFQDYALTELVINAIGSLPIEMYYSEGMQRLVKHDETSSVSYIDTLRTYLENNMSITKTTASLYINRSTLLERISRIKRDLGSNLQDPDERLRLQLLLKAAQLNEQIQKKSPQS